MVIWYFLIIISLLALIFSTITDLKKREVPDWISYSLILTSLGIRLIYSVISNNYNFILYGLLGFGIFFVIANILYYSKQWGGGDCKLLMGLGAAFGSYVAVSSVSKNIFPFLLTLFVNILIAGVIWGVCFAIYLSIKNKEKFVKEIKKQSFRPFVYLLILIFILSIASYLIFDLFLFKIIVMLFGIVFLAAIIISFTKIVENIAMYKFVEVSKLVEGDWIVNDVKKGNKIIVKVRNIGLTKKDIEILKKNKIQKVLVKEGIPFVPGFLIGFIVSIIFGDFLLFFI